MIKPKKSKKHLWISVGLMLSILLLLGLLAKGLMLNPQSVASNLIGQPAKDFSTELLQGASWIGKGDGKSIRLEDLKGKPLILNFWASWCVSCREEAQFFEAFWQRHKEQGIMMVGVAIQDTPEAAMEFAKAFGKTYPLGLDNTGKASIDYGVYGVPETFFIDKSGIIRHKETGPMSVELLESKLPLITQSQQ